MAIVVHRGSGAKAGHYHAAIRDLHHEVDWKPEHRKKPKFGRNRRGRSRRRDLGRKQSAKQSAKQRATAILVSILSDHEHLTINKLSREFNIANDSVSWNMAFETMLGSFRDFVRNHHRFRVLDESRRTFSVALDLSTDSDSHSEPDINTKSKVTAKATSSTKSRRKTRGRNLDGFVVDDDATDSVYEPDEDDDEDIEEDVCSQNGLLNGHPNGTQNADADLQNGSDSKCPPLPSCLSASECDGDRKESESVNDSKGDDQAVCGGPDEAHWFDFNDEDITALHHREIDDLWDGGDEECPCSSLNSVSMCSQFETM